MGLRITQNISINKALANIRRNAMRLNSIRNNLSTGRRVNKPSDDPSAFLRMLPIINNKADLVRFQENALSAQNILNTASSAFEDAVQIMSRAKELAVQGANGTLDATDRRNLASTTNQLLREMLSIANSRFGDRFLFSGAATATSPFELTETSSTTFVEYKGDDKGVSIEIAPGSEIEISTPGKKLFLSTNRGDSTFTGSTGAAKGTGTDSGLGQALLNIEHTGFSGLTAGLTAGSGATNALGVMSYTITAGVPDDTISINGGPAVPLNGSNVQVPVGTSTADNIFLDATAYVSAPGSGTLTSDSRMSFDGGQSYTVVDYSQTNQQLQHAGNGQVLNVNSTGIARTGTEQINFEGTFDAFNVLIALRDLLNNVQKLPPNEVASRITAIGGEVDKVMDQLLSGLQSMGARGSQLNLTKNRMSHLELTLEEALSRERDVDLTEVILRMSQMEVGFEAALAVGARVIQNSLLNFLR